MSRSTDSLLRDDEYEHDKTTEGFYQVQESKFARSSNITGLTRAWKPLALLVTLFIAFLAGQNTGNIANTDLVLSPTSPGGDESLIKPEGLRVVGLVFYGRRKFVDILDCYLRQNLVANNGWLDEVHFLARTQNEEDLEWLDDLVQRDNLGEIGYKVIPVNATAPDWRFQSLWQHYAAEPDTIYVKIDDDVVFIDENAIPRMVSSLVAHPEASSIQANVINNKGTYWYHYHAGDGTTILPFLPSTTSATLEVSASQDWRTSNLPELSDFEALTFRDTNWTTYLPTRHDFSPQYWSLAASTARNLQISPVVTAMNPDTPSKGGGFMPTVTWPIAAQSHYSLIHHLEHNTLSKYHFGGTDGLWNPWYHHFSINFMAIRGSTVQRVPFWDDAHKDWFGDENTLTEMLPRALDMPLLVDTHAIVAHYSFHMGQNQERWLDRGTDLLERYRGYANEMVCGMENQKVPFETA